MPKPGEQIASEPRDWCAGWIAGFLAAMFLVNGRRQDYERDRDECLTRKREIER